jgi:predicted Zn finger-like uncharacterized protein
MIVTCPACSARYKINQSKIQGRGAKITCPRCGHRFVVYRDHPDSALPSDVGSIDFGSVGLSWRVRQRGKITFQFYELSALQEFLRDGTIQRKDQISYDGREWRRLDELDDLEAHFWDVFQRARRGEIAPATHEESDDDEDETDMPTTIVGRGSARGQGLRQAVAESDETPRMPPQTTSPSAMGRRPPSPPPERHRDPEDPVMHDESEEDEPEFDVIEDERNTEPPTTRRGPGPIPGSASQSPRSGAGGPPRSSKTIVPGATLIPHSMPGESEARSRYGDEAWLVENEAERARRETTPKSAGHRTTRPLDTGRSGDPGRTDKPVARPDLPPRSESPRSNPPRSNPPRSSPPRSNPPRSEPAGRIGDSRSGENPRQIPSRQSPSSQPGQPGSSYPSYAKGSSMTSPTPPPPPVLRTGTAQPSPMQRALPLAALGFVGVVAIGLGFVGVLWLAGIVGQPPAPEPVPVPAPPPVVAPAPVEPPPPVEPEPAPEPPPKPKAKAKPKPAPAEPVPAEPVPVEPVPAPAVPGPAPAEPAPAVPVPAVPVPAVPGPAAPAPLPAPEPAEPAPAPEPAAPVPAPAPTPGPAPPAPEPPAPAPAPAEPAPAAPAPAPAQPGPGP